MTNLAGKLQVKNLEDYMRAVTALDFNEFPFHIPGRPLRLRHFVDLQNSDLDLKIHLAEVILCRCFPPTGGIVFPDDVNWYIKIALTNYYADLQKPWLTRTIKGAMSMIMSDDVFVKGVIGTTFMFGIVEFYAKNKLGWEPLSHDFFDRDYHKDFRKESIGKSIN